MNVSEDYRDINDEQRDVDKFSLLSKPGTYV